MKRVLHLSTAGWDEREGIARSVVALAERCGHEAHLAAARPSGAAFAGLHAVPGLSVPRPWSSRMREVIEDVAPDIVHLHGGEGVVMIARALSFACVPIVATVHRRASLPGWGRNPISSLGDTRGAPVGLAQRAVLALGGPAGLRTALRRRWLAAVCSPDERIVDRLVGSGPVFVCRGAASVTPERARWSEEPTIVFAGRAERGRGVDDLLEAFQVVRRNLPRARLRLELLPGPSAQRWARSADDQVTVSVGSLPALEPVFLDAQLAAVPFRLEMTMTPALVAAEAMSVGLPVVGTDVGCLTALVQPGRNGAIVRPGTPADLARAIVEVLASRERWEALSDGARETVARDWDWDQAALVVNRAYDAALPSHRPLESIDTKTLELGGPR